MIQLPVSFERYSCNTFSISPDSVITANPTICNGSITTLSVSGGSLGTGANWFWYIGSCGGLFEGNGDTIYVNPTITTDYYVRGEGICDTTSCGMIAINVNSISVQPDSVISANPAICNGSIAVLNVAGGSLGTGANWLVHATGVHAVDCLKETEIQFM